MCFEKRNDSVVEVESSHIDQLCLFVCLCLCFFLGFVSVVFVVRSPAPG